MNIIAHIENDFPTKFGIPRQSGFVESLKARIVFEPSYRNAEAVRGLSGFSHIWLIWEFSETKRETWSPTVRPPRLGGNTRVGVWATRSPFRPNPIGLSSVRLDAVEMDPVLGPVLYISGADLMNGTPIYDIKPYLPHVDAHPDATGSYATEVTDYELTVVIPSPWCEMLPDSILESLQEVLKQDPRPSYHKDPTRIYGFPYAGYEIKFQVTDTLLTVTEIKKEPSH